MVNINREMYQWNGIETLVDSNGILWSIEKQIKERLDKKLQVATVKYIAGHKKHRYELADEPKNNPTEF